MRGVEEQEGEELGEWEKVSKLVKAAAREVCGVLRRKIAQPWMVGREEEVSRLSEEIRLAVQERDSFLKICRARNRLRPRREDRRGDEVDRQVEGTRNRVKMARREHRSFLRRIEREWWEGVIEECEEACRLGRVEDVYKTLNRLSKRGWKAP